MTKTVAKQIHPLTDPNFRGGKITFTHKDGSKHTFLSVVNEMTGDRLSSFDNAAPSINDSITWVKSVFSSIRRKANVIESIGNF
jgi:hypothetical protein